MDIPSAEATRDPAVALPSAPRRPRSVVRAYLLLPHAVPVLVVMTATAGFAIFFDAGAPPAATFTRLLLAMLGGQIAIGAINEVVDAGLDTAAKPWKPIPAGLIAVPTAITIAAVSLVLMAFMSATLGTASLLLCSVGTATGLAYDLWFKRSLWSWLPYLVALPLLPIWVATALDAFNPRLLMLYPLGALAVIGVHLSQALPDVASDRAAGIRSLSSQLGPRRTLVGCWGATLTAPLLALLAAPVLAERPGIVSGAAIAVGALIGLNGMLYAVRPRAGVMACFPCVAISTVLMGLGWVVAVGN